MKVRISGGAQHPQWCLPFYIKYQNLQKTLHIFARAFTIAETLAFQIFFLESLGQGHVEDTGIDAIQLQISTFIEVKAHALDINKLTLTFSRYQCLTLEI